MTHAGGELRRNPVNGRLAIVAPGRAARPSDLGQLATRPAAARACPFCPGNEALTPPEVDAIRPSGDADSPGWQVRVVPNKYPALIGMHEVIIHSPDHEAELEDLGDGHLAQVLGVWQRRIASLIAAGAAAATLIVNRGVGAGASLEHPHAQLLGTPVVPTLLLEEQSQFKRHQDDTGLCILCAEIEGAGDRTVIAGDVAAWVPAASRFPGELWVAPSAHEASFLAADTAALARALRRVLSAVRAATAGAPLNLWVHTAPAMASGPFHWHIEIAPRTDGIAGLELGTDISLVSVDPVLAATAYREALHGA